MSSAHRPTWAPAMGKETRVNTRQYSSRDIAGHTKLKFRQPGQHSVGEIERRDLRLELELAEREAVARKRKAAGLPPLEEAKVEEKSREIVERITGTGHDHGDDVALKEDDEKLKRRKVMQEALEADKDDSDSDSDNENNVTDVNEKGKGKAKDQKVEAEEVNENSKKEPVNSDHDDDDDSDDDSDEEEETAALMRELEKIKRERAEEKERQERGKEAADTMDREEAIALGNPLLNLRAALGQSTSTMAGNASPSPSMLSSSTSAGFTVKRRWDDDVIFKNQARDVSETPKKEFVNDLLRTEFHKRFLKKFIA